MIRKWRLRPLDLDLSENLMEHLELSPLAARILSTRGVKNPEDGERFVKPSLSHLQSPFLMKDMESAVHRIMTALNNRERVAIYGDYDVDGITSTAILMAFLRELGIEPQYYIPDRISEGYGLNINAIKRLSAEKVDLLITTDCGVSNHHEIHEAGKLGLDTIVIDHHEVPDQLPPARAILNPKRKDCAFPFDGLSGVGVAFQLLIGLRAKLRERGFWHTGSPPNLKRYLDLVALGTISDMAPLLEENRVLVKFGLEELTEGKRQGIRALKALSGLDGRVINSGHVAFQLSPRLNACGRLAHADKAVELLLTDRMDEARKVASELEQLNSKRQSMEDQTLEEILKEIEHHPEILGRSCLLFSSSRWHPGLIGIVASRLVDRFGKPAFIVAISEENIGKGSARGTDGLDLYRTLLRCQGLLTGFGGHRSAAGFTVSSEMIEELRTGLENAVSLELVDQRKTPRLFVDAEVALGQIDHRLVEDLMLFEPYGIGNPRPLFLSRNLAVCDRKIVGKDSLKLKVRDRQIFDAIGFGMGDRFPLTSGPIDLVFTPQLNHWMGAPRIELEIKDLIPHAQESTNDKAQSSNS